MCSGCDLRVMPVVDKGVALWKLKFMKDEVLNLSHWDLLDLLCCWRFPCGYMLCGERVSGEVVESGRLVDLDIKDLGIDARVNLLQPEVVPCPS